MNKDEMFKLIDLIIKNSATIQSCSITGDDDFQLELKFQNIIKTNRILTIENNIKQLQESVSELIDTVNENNDEDCECNACICDDGDKCDTEIKNDLKDQIINMKNTLNNE